MLASNDDLHFYDIHVIFGEYCDTITVRHFSDGNQGPILEVVEDVSDLCFLGEFGVKGGCFAS